MTLVLWVQKNLSSPKYVRRKIIQGLTCKKEQGKRKKRRAEMEGGREGEEKEGRKEGDWKKEKDKKGKVNSISSCQ